MSKPNVILVMCDDLGYGDVGFNGNEVIQTPHLDAMAAEGLRFTRFYAGGPVCSPTRGTCLTQRPVPIPYRFLNQKDKMFDSPTLAMIDNQFKVLTNLSDTGEEDLCYDLLADPFEMNNVITSQRAFASDMQTALREWIASCEHSHKGGDYDEPFTPVFSFEEVRGDWSMRS